MDLIHKLSVTALVILTLITTGMLIQNEISMKGLEAAGGAQKIDIKKFYEDMIARNTKIYAEVNKLQNEKQFSQALEKLEEIRTAHPDNAQSDIYQAQIEYSQGEVAAAIHSFRVAVDRQPDYIDKRTPLFMSNEILDLINQSRAKFQREKKLKPNDRTILIALDDILYLQRRIAGGCE